MTESHLRNVLKMIIRNSINIPDTLKDENPERYCDDCLWL